MSDVLDSVTGKYVRIGGAPIYYETAGSGPALLCMHTAGRDNRQWQRYLEHYAPYFTVVAPDLPGHSKSSPFPGERLLDAEEEFTEFMWQFLDALGLEEAPVVMGCSLGGNLVFSLACARPDSVRAIISIEGTDKVDKPAAPFELLEHPSIRVPDWFMERLDTLLGSATPDDVRADLHWAGRQALPLAQLADLRAYSAFDVRADMHKIVSPALLIHGVEDWIVPRETVVAAANALTNSPDVRIIDMEGASHFAHMERTDECFRVIDEFLSSSGLLVEQNAKD